ncbi:hypothetical protein [Jongsikchunia kroppenstedtii]|uniref:hypothetical protein n=1 Tax=Jongsikchunia kroppenstedtii TaxID=1121721 RepID=UPI00037547FA|nr:hypothetical protein [Jongsikchunia kroppenstedtii]
MLRPILTRWSGPNLAAVAVIATVVALGVRVEVLASGGFYWDDLILFGRAGTHSLWSWDLLAYDHDGHFMPLAFWTAALVTTIAPMSWPAAAVSIVVLQALAAWGVWRGLRALCDGAPGAERADRSTPWVLAPFVLYLFSTLTVPADAWWAAALNTLPMQAAAGAIVADAIALCRTDDPRRRRILIVRSAVFFVLALGFFEKSLAILPIALVAVALWQHSRLVGAGAGARRPVRGLAAAWKGAAGLWLSMIAIALCWILAYLAVVADRPGGHQLRQTWLLVWRSLNQGIAAASVGGPLRWLSGWGQTPPVALPATWLLVIGWLVIAAIALWAWRTRVDAILPLIAVAGYVVGAQVVVLWQRSSAGTVLELAQTYRYLPDSALVCAFGLALIIAAPRRSGTATPRRATQLAVGVAVALAVIASVASTARFGDAWHQQGTQQYLNTARKSLADKRDARMIDQPVPALVLAPLAYPNNLASHVFAALPDRPEFGRWTDELWYLDDHGRIDPGAIYPVRQAAALGGSCRDPEVAGPVRRRLDGPLLALTWVAQIPYCADGAGEVAVGAVGGPPVVAPVQPGLHVLYVQFDGGGLDLQIAPRTPGLRLHLGTIAIGSGVGPRL